MNSVERPRAFLRSWGAKLALTVIPLASMAASVAQAATIFSPAAGGGITYVCSGCTGGSGLTVTALPMGANGIQGVQLAGITTFTSDGSTPAGITIAASGLASGEFTTDTMPVDYIFSVAAAGGVLTGWNVEFDVQEVFGHNVSYTDSGTGTVVNGLGTMTGLIGGYLMPDATSWAMSLTLDWTPSAVGDTLTVDLPLGINSSNTSVPEPVSVLLVGTGMGLLFLLRRAHTPRRMKSTPPSC